MRLHSFLILAAAVLGSCQSAETRPLEREPRPPPLSHPLWDPAGRSDPLRSSPPATDWALAAEMSDVFIPAMVEPLAKDLRLICPERP